MSDSAPARQPHAVEIKTEGDTMAARMVGPVIEANRAQVVLDTVGKAMDEMGTGLRFMVLDFDEITFINSTGIGMCLQLGTRAKALGARPILFFNDTATTEIYTRCRADTVYTIVRTEDELAKVLAD
jgi:anti-anti-sigma regulatory factor